MKPHKKARKKGHKPLISPLVSIVMGSQSDWETMQYAAEVLTDFRVPFEALVVSAHRTPHRLVSFATEAAAHGVQVIIAGAGGAAHLPGMVASLTTLPVFGVPVRSRQMDGLDSLLSIVQMPAGIPVGTLAVGEAGAKNAGLLSIAVLALQDKAIAKKLSLWRKAQTASVALMPVKMKKKK